MACAVAHANNLLRGINLVIVVVVAVAVEISHHCLVDFAVVVTVFIMVVATVRHQEQRSQQGCDIPIEWNPGHLITTEFSREQPHSFARTIGCRDNLNGGLSVHTARIILGLHK